MRLDSGFIAAADSFERAKLVVYSHESSGRKPRSQSVLSVFVLFEERQSRGVKLMGTAT
jgi:hypothetical protein